DSLAQRSMLLPMMSSTVSPTADIALLGHDPTPRLVAVQPLPPGEATGQALMRVYQRQEAGAGLRTEDVPFYPFFFLTDIRLLHDFPRHKFRCKTLRGSNAYCYLVVFTGWQTLWDAVSHIAKVTGRKDDTPEQVYLIPNPAQQYLMQTGRTLFKEMT